MTQTTAMPETILEIQNLTKAFGGLRAVSNFDLTVHKGALEVNLADEITAGTLVTMEGKVVHPMVLEAMGAVREGGASS
jgi:ABC-type uncharacterized transport system ATPase subunit